MWTLANLTIGWSKNETQRTIFSLYFSEAIEIANANEFPCISFDDAECVNATCYETVSQYTKIDTHRWRWLMVWAFKYEYSTAIRIQKIRITYCCNKFPFCFRLSFRNFPPIFFICLKLRSFFAYFNPVFSLQKNLFKSIAMDFPHSLLFWNILLQVGAVDGCWRWFAMCENKFHNLWECEKVAQLLDI